MAQPPREQEAQRVPDCPPERLGFWFYFSMSSFFLSGAVIGLGVLTWMERQPQPAPLTFRIILSSTVGAFGAWVLFAIVLRVLRRG